MKFTTSFLLAASFIASNTINASIFTTSPYDSITWQADTTVIITWNDNGKKPSLKDMGDVSIFLMTGNTQQVIVDTIVKSVKATAGKQEYKVKKNLGPPGKFYFLRYSDGKSSYYSGRFSIQGISGTVKGFDPSKPQSDPDSTTSADTTNSPSSLSSPSSDNSTSSKSSDPSGSKTENSASSTSSTSPSSSPTTKAPIVSAASIQKISSSAFAGLVFGAFSLALSYLF